MLAMLISPAILEIPHIRVRSLEFPVIFLTLSLSVNLCYFLGHSLDYLHLPDPSFGFNVEVDIAVFYIEVDRDPENLPAVVFIFSSSFLDL
jgi:hypothetical protein